jgi:hypothetical protein
MHSIERELIKATEYKVQRKFSDRQDYLKSIFNAAQKLSDDDFDSLSDEAATWLNECVTVYNSKRNAELPDFDEVEINDDDGEPEAEGDEDASEAEAEDSGEVSDPEDEPEDDDGDDEEVDDDDGEPEEYADSDSDEASLDDEVHTREEEDEPTPVRADEPKPKAVKKAKSKKEAKAKEPKVEEKKYKIPPPVKNKLKNQSDTERHPSDAELDKWGCLVGSKNAQALAMFERGATSREVKAELGGTYYNILGKMEQRGHRIEKDGALIKLTHKDSVAAKVTVKKGKK